MFRTKHEELENPHRDSCVQNLRVIYQNMKSCFYFSVKERILYRHVEDMKMRNHAKRRQRQMFPNDSFIKQWPYVEIYTDGSCLTNPGGPGGWAASIKCTNKQQLKQNRRYKEIYGSVSVRTFDVRTQTIRDKTHASYSDVLLEDRYVNSDRDREYIHFPGVTFHTITNNRMEMLAVIQALRCLKRSCNIKLYSDSQYVLNGMSKWSKVWLKSNWKQKKQKQADDEGFVKNHDLWRELYRLSLRHKIEYYWVKAHKGNGKNTNVDKLSKQAAYG